MRVKEEKKRMKRKSLTNRHLAIILIVIILLIVVASAIFLFSEKQCKSEECFLEALRGCERAQFVSSTQGNVWHYSITSFGTSQTCNVKVTNVKIASQSELAQKIEGKSMECMIPAEFAGAFLQIQSKLEFCSGPLKEALQDLLIDQLYNYIVQNIGEITEELRRG